MKVYDISRELFSTGVYPGDPVPYKEVVRRMDAGDMCNLSGFYTGCHSATHMDSPRHFVIDGDTIDQIPVERFVGKCSVVTVSDIVTGAQVDELLPHCEKMILFRGEGEAFLSQSAAFALADAGIQLVGTDAQSIAPMSDLVSPHRELLSAGIPILEGVDLTDVPDGTYTLIALPLRLQGLEASPVRAVLIEE
jgi:arylformamidase